MDNNNIMLYKLKNKDKIYLGDVMLPDVRKQFILVKIFILDLLDNHINTAISSSNTLRSFC